MNGTDEEQSTKLLTDPVNQDDSVTYNMGDGYKATFSYDQVTATYTQPVGIYLSLIKNADNSYTIKRKDNISLNFSPAGKLVSISDLNNNTITYTYTADHLTSITDTVGRTITITYDSSGRIASVQDPRNNPTTYSYDRDNNLAVVTDPMGYTTTYFYDDNHNLTKVISPGKMVSTLEYDVDGHVTKMCDGLSNPTTFSWNFNSGYSSICDPNGNTTSFDFDPGFGYVTSVQDALGTQSTFTYDANYNPLTITDPGGHTTTYTYDNMGNMLTKTDAMGYITTVTYNNLNKPLTVTDARGGVTTYQYDANGNLISLSDPLNYTTSYLNDVRGRRTRATDPQNGETIYHYDDNNFGVLDSITNAENHTSTFTYNNMGLIASSTDPDNYTTSYTYDDLGRLTHTGNPDQTSTTWYIDGDDHVSMGINANGLCTRYGYDAAGRLTTITDPMGGVTSYTYDPAGNRVRVTDQAGRYTDYTYDALNRINTSSNTLGNTVTYNYDDCGNMTEIVHPLGHVEFQEYDALHRKTASGRRTSSGGSNTSTSTYTYDGMGNVLTSTDPMGHTATNVYDLDNRLTSVTISVTPGPNLLPEPLVTSYTYDSCHNRTSATNANNHVTSYTYDKLGHVLTETLPGGYTTTYAYDPAGRLSTKTDPKNQTIQYAYDPMGRLESRGSGSFSYDGMGNRMTMQDGQGATFYYYDANSRLTRVIDSYGREIDYAYDAAGNRTSMVTPVGTQTYEYDSAGRIIATTDFYGNRITLSYDSDGKQTAITFPGGNSETYTYNDLDQTTDIDWTAGSSNYHADNTFNANGMMNTLTASGTLYSPSQTYTYSYDEMNRLTYCTSGSLGKGYTYDHMGNRTLLQDGLHNVTTNYTYDQAERLSAKGESGGWGSYQYAYQYDNNGNLTYETQDGTRFGVSKNTIKTYEYDSLNRLTRTDYTENNYNAVSTERYYYNGDDLPMKVESSSTQAGITSGGDATYYLYDGKNVIADLDPAGAVIKSYTRLPDGRLLDIYESYQLTRDVYYVFTNYQGSTMCLYGRNGTTWFTFDYDDFGSMESGSGATRYTFTGAPCYSGGLYLMGARFYNPSIGRFITRDTYRGNIYQPWTQNLYTYCNNNPINFTDPTGHTAVAAAPAIIGGASSGPGGWIAIAVGAVVTVIAASDSEYEPGQDLPNGEVPDATQDLTPGQDRPDLIGEEATSEVTKGGYAPQNLNEQLAAEEAISYPTNPDATEIPNCNNDPRYSDADGWQKMAQNVNGIEVHYQYNKQTGEVADVKIKG